MLLINDDTSYEDFKVYLTEDSPETVEIDGDIIRTEEYEVRVTDKYRNLLDFARNILENKVEFNVEGYATEIVENQGYKFVTFKE